MNGVTQPDGPPSIFVMFGRKTVVVGVPGVPHAAADTLSEPAAVVVAAAGLALAPSVMASTQTSTTATFLTAASIDERRAALVSARSLLLIEKPAQIGQIARVFAIGDLRLVVQVDAHEPRRMTRLAVVQIARHDVRVQMRQRVAEHFEVHLDRLVEGFDRAADAEHFIELFA